MVQKGKLEGVALACGIALSLTLAASAASAFSPEPAQPAPTQNTAQPNQPNQPQQPAAGAGQFADPFADAGKSKGTEVTIPGVGSVGKLPKLDFGLELLYGAQNGQEVQAPTGGLQLDQRNQDSDMQIKGSLKHKF